jgi:hypothetical protein
MSEHRSEQLHAASGLVFVGLMLAAAAVGFWFPGWGTGLDASARNWATFYSDHRTSILVSVLLVSTALIFLTWFAGILHGVLRRAEGGEPFARITFGAGIFGVGAIHVAMICFSVAAFRARQMPPNLVMMMNDMAFFCGVPAAAAGVSFFAAIALGVLRTGALPRWLGWLAALSAVLQLGPLGGLFTETGAFNLQDGLFGIMLVFITLGVWVALASLVLIQRARDVGGPRAAVPGGVTA